MAFEGFELFRIPWPFPRGRRQPHGIELLYAFVRPVTLVPQLLKGIEQSPVQTVKLTATLRVRPRRTVNPITRCRTRPDGEGLRCPVGTNLPNAIASL